MQSQGVLGVNQLGGHFVNGCALPDSKRRQIVHLALGGLRASDISRCLKVSNGCVSKILTRYFQTGAVQPKGVGGSRPRMATPQVVATIARMKQEQPSIFAWEIREKLQAEGSDGSRGHLPSVSSINRILRSLQVGSQLLDQGPRPITPLQSGPHSPKEKHPGHSAGMTGTPPTPLGAQEAPRAPSKPPNRHRTIFSKQQLELLEQAFQRGPYPERATRKALALAAQLQDATIRVWFSNRRARGRREARTASSTDPPGTLGDQRRFLGAADAQAATTTGPCVQPFPLNLGPALQALTPSPIQHHQGISPTTAAAPLLAWEERLRSNRVEGHQLPCGRDRAHFPWALEAPSAPGTLQTPVPIEAWSTSSLRQPLLASPVQLLCEPPLQRLSVPGCPRLLSGTSIWLPGTL